jgi:anti-sigma B factor antagonist
MEGIQVSTEIAGSRNHISIIKVGGYIDTTTSSELERALDALLKQGRFFIIVDLGNVDYISSAGWGIFISEIKSIRENGGDLKLVRMVPDVYEIFELLEFHHILDVYDTVEEAINKFEVLEAAGKSVAKEITLPKPEAQQSSPGSMHTSQTGSSESQPQSEKQSQTDVVTEEELVTNPADLSLAEKIKMVVKENPSFSPRKIKRELYSARFGYSRVGWLAVRSELKKLNLLNRTKRYEFATRS